MAMRFEEFLELTKGRSDADIFLGVKRVGEFLVAPTNKVSLEAQFAISSIGRKRKENIGLAAKNSVKLENLQKTELNVTQDIPIPSTATTLPLYQEFIHSDSTRSSIDFGDNIQNKIVLSPETKPVTVTRTPSDLLVIQKFLTDPATWDRHPLLFQKFQERIRNDAPKLLSKAKNDAKDLLEFNTAFRYLYVEAIRTLASKFYSENIKKNKVLMSLCANGLNTYVEKIDALLNNLDSAAAKNTQDLLKVTLNEEVFASPKPRLQNRTGKERTCLLTGKKIDRGSRAYVVTLYKKRGRTTEIAEHFVSVNERGEQSLYVDVVYALITFAGIRCLLIGKIINYPEMAKEQRPLTTVTVPLKETEMEVFRRFVNDEQELLNLLTFQYKVVKSAEKCLTWLNPLKRGDDDHQ